MPDIRSCRAPLGTASRITAYGGPECAYSSPTIAPSSGFATNTPREVLLLSNYPRSNSATMNHPGFFLTDLNGHRGTRTPEQGAAIAIKLPTLSDDGPTGTYSDDTGPIAW